MLVELGPRVRYAPGGVNIGVLSGTDGRVVLVDSGLNDSAAKKVLKAVREELGGAAEVAAVLTTHGHADHFGGNATVAKRTGAMIYAPATDEAILRYPMLLPMALYGGADPLDTMRTGFLLGDASPVDDIVGPGPLTVAGLDLEVVPLYGHSPGQVGYLVDGVFFCADVVLPVAALEKYRVPYLYSATDHFAALETARAVECRVAVAGHGPLLEDRAALHALIDANLDLLDRVADRVVAFAAEPVTADAILTDLLRHFGATPGDAPSFYLLQPTAFAFVSHLHRQGRLRHEVRDGQSLWQAA